MFDRLLIANRGEIACRIIATCRRLGVATVAVYSDADAEARHVRLADQAVRIGPAASRDSYLAIDRIVAAARATGAQAIHPGYGFLSENAAFADACAAAGIAFVGPPAPAIRAMGSKAEAKALMVAAEVPVVPGYHGDDQDAGILRAQADRIGYPLLIKAVAGGGGKGMRVVERGGEFAAALASCRREASASFGDDRVLLERYLRRPRHIEIQVFADTHDNVVHLYERDCSAQRRHQKVIEEAPAPHLSAGQRQAMGGAACDAARAVGYVGAGTVEFIVDADGAFWFLEMNTRLQVEHPVTEAVTGQDLVEWQLRVAGGEPLPLTQDRIALDGHAIEARIYAEEPAGGFLPSTGRLLHFAPPALGNGLRLDTGVDQGDVIGPHYDPMIAKLVAWAPTRDAAMARLRRGLAEFRIVGVHHNIPFLSALLAHPDVAAGQVDTGLIGRELDRLLPPAGSAAVAPRALHAAALWLLQRERMETAPRDPWAVVDGWRINAMLRRELAFQHGGRTFAVEAAHTANGLLLDGQPAHASAQADGRLTCVVGEHRFHATVVPQGDELHVLLDDGHIVLRRHDPLAIADGGPDTAGSVVAPMPGRIVALVANPGADIEQGAPLLVMEAMKMEYTLQAPADGIVRGFLCEVGELVADKAQLVDFEARG